MSVRSSEATGVAAGSPSLVAAARATLAASSARVWSCAFLAPPVAGDRGSGDVYEGVTSFASCRTETTCTLSSSSLRAAEEFARRQPWLVGEEEGDDDEPARTIHAGTSVFFLFPTRCAVLADRDDHAMTRSHSDPTWIVEVLSYAATERSRDDDGGVVRGAACRRQGFDVDLELVRGRMALPVRRGHRAPRLRGEAWVDDAGLIRRVTWQYLEARRPRARRRRRFSGTGRGWHTTELWDFGTPVDIELPQHPPGTRSRHLEGVRALWDLWRAKREHERSLRT
jgi:hypothetical protein